MTASIRPYLTALNAAPFPHEPEATCYIPAGSILLGVEHRHVGEDHGVSLHVFDAATQTEYLRFDCFDQEPHYHYITPETADHELVNWMVPIDEVALGPALPWALSAIRERLAPMLRRAGADDLAASIDAATLEQSMIEMRKQALRLNDPNIELTERAPIS